MEDAYIIQGGYPLRGEVQLSGAKNVALKVIIASLLFKNKVHLANIPKIKDIEELLHLIRTLGGKAEFIKKNTVVIDGSGINTHQVDFLHASKIRVSFMLFAPLLFKFGQALIPNPGGCRIGSRPIDRQIDLMKAFGITVSYCHDDGYYHAKLNKEKINGIVYQFDKSTHTGTELAILFGGIASGQTIINNASQEPEIDDLINFLNLGGAKIKRVGRKIHVEGVRHFKQNQPYTIINDRNEAVTYAIFALATKGEVTVSKIEPPMIEVFIRKVEKAGGGVTIDDGRVRFFYKNTLRAIDVTTVPHPGFMTDWQAPWAVLMTQVHGTAIIHETVFENRFSYVEELKKLGAQIEYFQPKVNHPDNLYQFNLTSVNKLNPQAIKIYGETKLHNGVLNVFDLRAGANLLIAAMIASGESIVNGASIIDRGYEEIDKKLKLLGAKIEKV